MRRQIEHWRAHLSAEQSSCSRSMRPAAGQATLGSVPCPRIVRRLPGKRQRKVSPRAASARGP
ncbi:hypothetical protein D516_0545 [Rhodobacter sp. AKP1]|nr:hypothetical protein D516_0545 [Rhodobacter sp. AKP1]